MDGREWTFPAALAALAVVGSRGRNQTIRFGPMFSVLRGSHLLGLMLALVVPGLAPAWLDAADPCPHMAPWLVEHQGGHDTGEGHDAGGSDSHHGCTCQGSCHVGTVSWAPSTVTLPTVAAPLAADRLIAASGLDQPPTPPSYILPPATAPPNL